MSQRLSIAAFLLGSAGDVHPGISIVYRLAKHGLPGLVVRSEPSRGLEIHVVTHQGLCAFYGQYFADEAPSKHEVLFHAVESDTDVAASNEMQRGNEEAGMRAVWNTKIRQTQVKLVIFNLFAFNAWNFAESLDIPSLGVASFPRIHARPPEAFAEAFCDTYPRFSSALKASRPPTMNWDDVLSWQWRIFIDDAARFRSACEMTEVPFEYLIEDFEDGKLGALPDATPVISTVSPNLSSELDRLTGVDGNANWHLVGPLPALPAPAEHQKIIEIFVSQFLTSIRGAGQIILVHFGSMRSLSARLADASHLSRSIAAVAVELNIRAAQVFWIETEANQPFPQSISALELPKFLPFTEFVVRLVDSNIDPVVIHHGGSGTTQTMLKLGIRQIVVPLRFDQWDWAQLVQSLDRGRTVELEAGPDQWRIALDWCRTSWLEPLPLANDNAMDRVMELIRTVVGAKTQYSMS